MLSETFIEYVLSDEQEYISVRDLAGEDVLRLFATQATQQDPRIESSEELIESLLELADRVFVKFPKVERDVQKTAEVPQVEPEEVGELLQKQWPDIQKRMTRHAADRGEEEWPIIVDMFQVSGITFGYQLEDKEENLSAAMDFFVATEEYEKAADMRDQLDKIGSNKVKQQ